MKFLIILALITLVASKATEPLQTPAVEIDYHNKIEAAEPSVVEIDYHNKIEAAEPSVVEIDYHSKIEAAEPSVVEIDYHNKIGIPAAARIKAAEEAADFDGARIVGGSPASLGQFPYMAGLVITLTNEDVSVGGASLLSHTRLVTAARCWRSFETQATQFVVVLGSRRLFSGGTRITTADVELHANYNMFNFHNDIAIIKLHWVSFNDYISPIALASGNNQYVGTSAWAAGFGQIRDGLPVSINQNLSHANLQIISNNACAGTYGWSTVIQSTLCATSIRGSGTCIGDAGGPLVAFNERAGWQLIGVTSFRNSNGCQWGPYGFARVTSFHSWISARLETGL